MKLDRRQFLATGLAGGAAALLGGGFAHAQAEALRIGVLTPLTGGGAVYGTTMSRMYTLLADEINKAGGVAGKPIQLFTEDDQTNPDAGVRGARQLVDVKRARHHGHLVERRHPRGGADRRQAASAVLHVGSLVISPSRTTTSCTARPTRRRSSPACTRCRPAS
jgi:ABC-type branched-subunit amino acid transport system substrate-binding protein